jgi:hypothetical protein
MGDPKQDRGAVRLRRASETEAAEAQPAGEVTAHRASLAKVRGQINARAVRQARRWDDALLRLRPRK